MDFPQVDLSRPLKQRDFAALVGVAPQTISEWVKAGHLRRGDSAFAWLRAYIERLQHEAAERGCDSTLVAARTRLANEQAVAVAMKNAQMRREWAPAVLVDAVIGAVGRQLQAEIATIVPAIGRECPQLPEAARHIVEAQVAKAIGRAAGIGTASAVPDTLDDDE